MLQQKQYICLTSIHYFMFCSLQLCNLALLQASYDGRMVQVQAKVEAVDTAVTPKRTWQRVIPKNKSKIRRCTGNGNDRKRSNCRRPPFSAHPLTGSTSTITTSPQAQALKRKKTEAQLEIELSLSWRKNKLAENQLQKVRAEKVLVLKQKNGVLLCSKDKKQW